jgi:hypothetical protein
MIAEKGTIPTHQEFGPNSSHPVPKMVDFRQRIAQIPRHRKGVRQICRDAVQGIMGSGRQCNFGSHLSEASHGRFPQSA